MRAMRVIAVLAAIGLTAAPTAGAAGSTGIKGRVVDLSCPGPCYPDDTGHPFAGPGEIVVKRVSNREVVRRTTVDAGAFRVGVRAGSYSVRVIPYPDEPGRPCWDGDKQRVRVEAGELARIRLEVRNSCLL
jgi:hypothetical protein